MAEQLQEDLQKDAQVLNADITSEKNGTWVDMSKHDRVIVYADATNLSGGDTVTLTIQEADDTSGTNSQDLSTTTKDSSGGSDVAITKEHKDNDLSSGKTAVRVQLKSEGTSVTGSAISIRGEGRYDPQN